MRWSIKKEHKGAVIWSTKTSSQTALTDTSLSPRWHEENRCTISLHTSLKTLQSKHRALWCSAWMETKRTFLQNHVCSAGAEHEPHDLTLLSVACLTPQSAIYFSCVCNYKGNVDPQAGSSHFHQSFLHTVPLSPELTKVESLVQLAHLHSQSALWQKHVAQLNVCSPSA